MTRDDIIRLAREAGWSFMEAGMDVPRLERFAALIAKHTLSNIDPSKFMSIQEGIEAGRVSEREACAKFFDDNDTNMFWGSQAASHIRTRGQA